MSSPPSDPEEQAPDGACSDLYDLVAALIDCGSEGEVADDLCLFIERRGLAEEAIAWLHGRADGSIPGRIPYDG